MIKDDSRKIQKGDTFIALKKVNDGHDYVIDAINNGASRVIVEKGLYDVEKDFFAGNSHVCRRFGFTGSTFYVP